MARDGVTSMKRYLILALAALIPALPAYAAEIPDEQLRIVSWSNDTSSSTQGELFDDFDVWSFIPSQIQIPTNEMERAGLSTGVVCDSVEDAKCKDFLVLMVRAYLPTCTDAQTQYCIESLFAIKNGVRYEGNFKQPYPDVKTFGQFEAEPKYDLPAGGAGGLWQIPGLTHNGGGDLYWINAQLIGSLNRASQTDSWGKFNPNQLWSSISAVTEVSAPGSVAPLAYKTGGSGTDTRPLTPTGEQCLVAGVDKCLLPWPLNEEIQYGMKVRLAHPITGWLHGRLNAPDFTATTTADGFFHLTMVGNPVKVPTVFAITDWDKATPEIKARFGGKPSGCCGGGTRWFDTAGRYQSGEQMVADLKMWLPYIQEKASATPTYWIVRTLPNHEIANKRQCLVSGAVNGIVTTNATAYTSGAPKFNQETQSLDYQVASPHNDRQGKVNVGNYNLQINSAVARCLYGFTNAPISATVSIVSENGENQVATTTIKESNGWIYLKAAGFTYSSPTVKVKFEQKSPEVVTVAAKPAKPAPITAKKSTITCAKGKVITRVTAVKPLCPAGYKKR